MSEYIIGGQAWYDQKRQRLVDISKRLGSVNELTEEERDKLYFEQNRIVCELDDNWNKKLINTPLNL